MPYRPACPKLSASQHGDDRKSRDAKTAMAWPATSPSLGREPPSFCARRRRIDAPIWPCPGELFPASPLPTKSIARRYAWDIFSFCCSKWRFYRQRLQFAAAIRTLRQREHIGADEFRRNRERVKRSTVAPSLTRRAASGQPRIRRALFPKCHRGISRHARHPCRTVRPQPVANSCSLRAARRSATRSSL
jgi:hypothetical protein